MKDGWVTGLASAVTALGLLFYAALRIGYSVFYAPLGLQPEDVGLGYADILAQSLVGLILAALLVVYFGGTVFGLAEYARDTAENYDKILDSLRSVLPRYGATALVTAACIAIALVWLFAGADVAAPLLTLFGAVLLYGVYRGRSERVQRRVRLVIAGLTVTFALGLAFALLIGGAAEDAGRVKRGHAAHERFLGVPVVAWGATVATVQWVGNKAPSKGVALPAGCLLYLGRSDRGVVLFDPATDESIRVPADDVVVTVTDRDHCPRT